MSDPFHEQAIYQHIRDLNGPHLSLWVGLPTIYRAYMGAIGTPMRPSDNAARVLRGHLDELVRRGLLVKHERDSIWRVAA